METVTMASRGMAIVRLVRSDDIPLGKHGLVMPSTKRMGITTPLFGAVLVSSIEGIESAAKDKAGKWHTRFVLLPCAWVGEKGTFKPVDGEPEPKHDIKAVVSSNQIYAVLRDDGLEPWGDGFFVMVKIQRKPDESEIVAPDRIDLKSDQLGEVTRVGRKVSDLNPGDIVCFPTFPAIRCMSASGDQFQIVDWRNILYRRENCA